MLSGATAGYVVEESKITARPHRASNCQDMPSYAKSFQALGEGFTTNP